MKTQNRFTVDLFFADTKRPVGIAMLMMVPLLTVQSSALIFAPTDVASVGATTQLLSGLVCFIAAYWFCQSFGRAALFLAGLLLMILAGIVALTSNGTFDYWSAYALTMGYVGPYIVAIGGLIIAVLFRGFMALELLIVARLIQRRPLEAAAS